MQNRFVLSGIPSIVPTLSKSIDSIRDIVEEQSCWVDRIAFLPTSTTTSTVECCIELHLENERDCAIASLHNQMIVLNRMDGTRMEEEESSNKKKKNIIWFQIKAYPSTIEQSQRLLELCPTLENDDDNNKDCHYNLKSRIQTVSFSNGIHLTISQTTTTNGIMERQCGGTGAEVWRGGYLLALQISSWLSSSLLLTNHVSSQQGDRWWSQFFHSKTNVLELGAGLAGLPSMVLAMAKRNNLHHDFPNTIVATDGVDEIVSLLKYNVHCNHLSSFLNVQHLDWNDQKLMKKDGKNRKQCYYDTILFADCIYTDIGAKLLAKAIRELIVPGGNVIGVLPDFRVGLNLFQKQMIQNGFSPTKLIINNNDDDNNDGCSKFLCCGNNGKHYTMVWWQDMNK